MFSQPFYDNMKFSNSLNRANWHKKVGRACKKDFEEFVEVSNKAAVNNGYKDTGDSWKGWYEDDQFEELADRIWGELIPLYSKLYAYARLCEKPCLWIRFQTPIKFIISRKFHIKEMFI